MKLFESKTNDDICNQVSRQGDWLVFTEKIGVLTTQNGTQTITEKRVKMGTDDLEKLMELGY